MVEDPVRSDRSSGFDQKRSSHSNATATEAFIGPTPNPSVPVPVVPTADPSGPSAVAKANTSIYSGPGTDYILYGAFVGGQTRLSSARAKTDQWWAISVPVAPTGAGWVSAGWVKVQNADNVPVLPTPPVPANNGYGPTRSNGSPGDCHCKYRYPQRSGGELSGLWHRPGWRHRTDHR